MKLVLDALAGLVVLVVAGLALGLLGSLLISEGGMLLVGIILGGSLVVWAFIRVFDP